MCITLGEERAEAGMTRMYKPTSKLLDKKSSSLHSSKPTKSREEEKPERPVINIPFRLLYTYFLFFIHLLMMHWKYVASLVIEMAMMR